MAKEAKIKCLVFDLDNTLWSGVLSEGGADSLIDGIFDFITELDRRGIIMSIASKNNEAPALKKLDEYGLSEYFLCPKINWNSKAESIKTIISELNIKPGSVAFLDDNPFERDEVTFAIPDVRAYDAADFKSLLSLPEFTPTFITEDAMRRREMYRADMSRAKAEEGFVGSSDEFLRSLDMKLDISPVTEGALRRVEELTIRTHQLNSTGYTYSYDELKSLISSPDHIFLIASLTDKYGDSGKVGLLLLERGVVCGEAAYILKLLIVSCRVMTRGVGTALLTHAIRLAAADNLPLFAEFLETEHNRIMYITYKLAGFEEIDENDEEGTVSLLLFSEEDIPDYPPYLAIKEGES